MTTCRVAKGRRRVTELQERYDGLKILVTKPRGPKGHVEVNLIGADPDSRRAAARSIIDDLPIEVDVDFRGAQLNSAIKTKSYVYRVDVTENGDGSYCLFGRPDSCKQYYEYVCYELNVCVVYTSVNTCILNCKCKGWRLGSIPTLANYVNCIRILVNKRKFPPKFFLLLVIYYIRITNNLHYLQKTSTH